ncbi:glyoxalase superfamily protein (plasmid) [Pseudomonas silesiensis]|uniref:glyoxalase superfamily protein n=1 Tax=Pseudomonas silesiensis TaxID=1853130 RepID=UPI0030D099AB
MQNEHIAAAKNLATNLIEILAAQGIDLKRTQALEVVSKLQDHTDWNRLSAKLKGRGKQGKSRETAAFALISRPGYGKTETIRALFELECADGETCPLLIDVGGCGTLADLVGKDPFMVARDRIKLFYDNTGIVHVEKTYTDLCREPVGRGLVVDLWPLGNYHELRKFSGVALAQFLDNPAKYVREPLLKRIGTVFLDEYHRLEDQDVACCEAMGRFIKGLTNLRRVVIGTQLVLTPEATEAIGLPFCHLIPEPELVFRQHKWPWVYRALPKDLPWESESLDDHRVVSDLLMKSFGITNSKSPRTHPIGASRLGRLPGHVTWFKQLRDAVWK